MAQVYALQQEGKNLSIIIPDKEKASLTSSAYETLGRLISHLNEVNPCFRVGIEVTKDKISVSGTVSRKTDKVIDIHLEGRRSIDVYSTPQSWIEQSERFSFAYGDRLREIFPDYDVHFID